MDNIASLRCPAFVCIHGEVAALILYLLCYSSYKCYHQSMQAPCLLLIRNSSLGRSSHNEDFAI